MATACLSVVAGDTKPASIKTPFFGGGEDGMHHVEDSLADSEYGPGHSALYPHALQLSGCSGGGVVPLAKAPNEAHDGYKLEGGKLYVDVPEGASKVYFEVPFLDPHADPTSSWALSFLKSCVGKILA